MASDDELKQAPYASKDNGVVLRPHEYDGIREYDQTLPNWWLFIFFATLALFPLWWLAYYQFGFFDSDEEKLGSALARIEEFKAKELDEMLAKLNDRELIEIWAKDDAIVNAGRGTYATNCAACHGQDLSGRIDLGGGQSVALPGLPLTDGEWKYGARPMDVFKIIHDGTPEDSPGHNGARMEAWGRNISPLKIAEITAFLIRENPDDFSAEPE